MPKPVAYVNYHECQVEKCEQGICLATHKCPRNILRQETLFEMPEIKSEICRGCGICVPVCPFGAIQVR